MLISSSIYKSRVRYFLFFFNSFFFNSFLAFVLILLYPFNLYPNKTFPYPYNKKQLQNNYTNFYVISIFKNKFKNKTYGLFKTYKNYKNQNSYYKNSFLFARDKMLFHMPNNKNMLFFISIKNYLNIDYIDYLKNFKSSKSYNLFYSKLAGNLLDKSIILSSIYDNLKTDYMSYYYVRPYNFIKPFMNIKSWRLKTDNVTLYLDYRNKDFSLKPLPTAGIKYQLDNGLQLYYFIHSKISFTPLQGSYYYKRSFTPLQRSYYYKRSFTPLQRSYYYWELSFNFGISFSASLFQ